MVSPSSCHQPHKEFVQTRDVGVSADWRPFQLSMITLLHSQRKNEVHRAAEETLGLEEGKAEVEGKWRGKLNLTLVWEKV